jgi:hypothetical protein
MKSVAAVVLLLAAATGVGSQSTSSSPPPPAAQDDRPQVYRTTRARIAIGRSVHVAADEEVLEAVIAVGGSAKIDGRVRAFVVVVGGNLEFGPKADVRGEIVVVGGVVTRAAGAQVRGPVTDISFGNWSNWTFGGISLPVVDFGDFGRWLSLFGTIFRVALLALLMGGTILIARAPVARIGRSAAAQPGKAFALGLVAELLFVPILVVACVSLIITIVGIPLVVLLLPIALLIAFVALLLGFTAMMCRLGEWVEDLLHWRGHSALLATAVGLILVVGPTMMARLIGVAPDSLRWATVGLLTVGIGIEFVFWTVGLGATLMTGFGRWSTAPPPAPPMPQPSILPATN